MFKKLFEDLMQEVKSLHDKVNALEAKYAPVVDQEVKLAAGEAEKVAEAVDAKLSGVASESAQPAQPGSTNIPVVDGDADGESAGA